MDKKVERKFSRLELADYLAALSEQLRQGQMEAEGRTFAVPEEVGAKLHLKEEDGCFVAKLSWRWSLRGDYRQVPREPRPSAAPAGRGAWKAVKTGLAATFKEVQRAMGQGLFPDETTLTDLVEGCRRFAAMAQPEWGQAMDEFMAHLESWQQAVHRREMEAALRELQALKDGMTTCHREFK